jgi:hypothetical protein
MDRAHTSEPHRVCVEIRVPGATLWTRYETKATGIDLKDLRQEIVYVGKVVKWWVLVLAQQGHDDEHSTFDIGQGESVEAG